MALFEALSSALGSITALVTGRRNQPREAQGDGPSAIAAGPGSVVVGGTITGTVHVYRSDRKLANYQAFDDESDVESSVVQELPDGWVETLDELPPDERREAARRMWADQVARISQHASEFPSDESDVESTVERELPYDWIQHLDKLTPVQRSAAAKELSESLDSGISRDLQPLWPAQRPEPVVVAGSMSQGVDVHFTDPPEPLSLEESAAVADRSGNTIGHALAMLFIRLGPPPEPTELDYAPAGNGGGGVQQ